jgi:hypothetical protein
MSTKDPDSMNEKLTIGLLSNGKHNANLVLQWFGYQLVKDFGIQIDLIQKNAPSGPAEETIFNRLAMYAAAVIGTAD